MKPLIILALALSSLAFVAIPEAAAHCDTRDGPVVAAGKKALETGNLDHALIWVPPAAEPELRALFEKIVAARKEGTSAEAEALLADYFLETLVRLHRSGEGEPYTGIVDRPADPLIQAVDASLADGSSARVGRTLRRALSKSLQERFAAARALRGFDTVAEGREYIHAYVEYLHFVESFHALVSHR